jgi:cold shock CspA family protein
MDMSKIYTGKIIYWNSYFGFIESIEFEKSIFFHSTGIEDKQLRHKLSLLDNVSFKIRESKSIKHKGEPAGYAINLLKKGDLTVYNRMIGTIYDWNGRFGFIDYPTENNKKIFLFHTRLLFSKKIQNGQLVVFNPINSKNDDTQFFAFFAYPITYEKDSKFIFEQYKYNNTPKLKEYILSTNNNLDLRFELELVNLGEISIGQSFITLTKILDNYKTQYNYVPNSNLLLKYVPETYLIQLFEMGLINTYNVEIIKKYFINASADTKRLIASKVSVPDRSEILSNYFEFLQRTDKNQYLNNDIRILLDIVYRNPLTNLKGLYKHIKSTLLNTLQPEEIIDLWLHDYMDGLPEDYVIKNFKIDESDFITLLLQKTDENGDSKYKELLSKIFEEYFINTVKYLSSPLSPQEDFDSEYPTLIQRLYFFKNYFSARYLEIIKIFKSLKSYQKFVLWIFNIDLDFDAYSYTQENFKEINHYYKLKFILRILNDDKNVHYEELLDLLKITQEGLAEFAQEYKWNNTIYPITVYGCVRDEYLNYFINDIDKFNEKCNQVIDSNYLADEIYQSVEKYNEIHIRLWMHKFRTDKTHYDYVGFRESFKSLTKEEKKIFRDYGNNYVTITNVVEAEKRAVKPCTDFIENSNCIIYSAFIENVYFGNGHFKLKKENSRYTEQWDEPYSSSGLNRIPSTHALNKIQFQIAVNKEDNKISYINGLEEIFFQIHTGEIEKALGQVKNIEGERDQFPAYVEDWKLRKDVIDYLNENQVSYADSAIVYEPKNFYRHLDEKSGISDYELTKIFTIETEDGCAIVWENIDLTEDRATYVFKCIKENIKIQINKITDAIISLAQLRSTLSLDDNNDEVLKIFKNNLGYIASIRKERGRNKPFSNWLGKLKVAFRQPIPELPPPEDIEKMDNWVPENSHHPKLNKKIEKYPKKSRIIKKEELETTDIFDQEENSEQIQTLINKSDTENITKRQKILRALKNFNDIVSLNLKLMN